MMRRNLLILLIFGIIYFSTQTSIIELDSLVFHDDKTEWKSVSESEQCQLWLSKKYLYLLQPDTEYGNLTLLYQLLIPPEYADYTMAYMAQVDNSFAGTLNILMITKSEPDLLIEVQITFSNTQWETIRNVTIPNVPTGTVFTSLISDGTGGFPGTLYIFGVFYVAAVTYNTFNYMSACVIPPDQHFDVDVIVGLGIDTPSSFANSALFAVRGKANQTQVGGDIVLLNIVVVGEVSFDHQVYLLTAPQAFTVFSEGMVPYLYWLQTDPGIGMAYEWDYNSEVMTYSNISFASDEVWSTSFSLMSNGQMALLASGVNQYTEGYTLRSFTLEPIQIADELHVKYDTLPTLTMEADYGSSPFSVIGTRDGPTGSLKLVFYNYDNASMYDPSFEMAKMAESRSQQSTRMRILDDFSKDFSSEFYSEIPVLPPTCTSTPICGPKYGLNCPQTEECFLATTNFLCCVQCPNSC